MELVEGVPGLYIDVKLWGEKHSSEVILSGNHTNVYKIVQDGNVLYDQSLEAKKGKHKGADRNLMSLEGILEYASTVDLEKVRDVLETEIKDNAAISQEGLDHPWGTQVGRTIRETIGDSVMARAEAAAAAGSDARMSGCPKPVVINAGSGNQGITASVPVVIFAESLKSDDETRLRAVLLSDLVTIALKQGGRNP